MKKLLKPFILSIVLFSAATFSSFAQKELPTVTLSCTQHTVDYSLNLGLFTVTYHVLWTICDNGTEYWDIV